MKFTQILKYSSITAAACFLLIYFSACKQDQNTEDPKDVASEKNAAKFENSKEDDARFLVDVAEFNLQQAELGKLTSLKSSNSEIRDFGKMMASRHYENLKDLGELASSRQISIPNSLTDDNKEHYNRLNRKDIDDFDNDYIDGVISDHKEAIHNYTAQLDKTGDPEIKKWINIELASLREHLDNAMTLQLKLKKKQ